MLRFGTPDHEWVQFVKNNRLVKGYRHEHDIVVGSVADDAVYDSFAIFLEGAGLKSNC